MKRSSIVLCFIVLSFYAHGQFSSGTIQIGGGISYYKSSSDNESQVNARLSSYSSSQFAFFPRAGIFLTENSSLGVKLGYSKYSSENLHQDGSDINRSSTTRRTSSVGIYYRHFIPLFNKVYFFIEPHVGISSGPEKQTNSSGISMDGDYKSLDLSVSPGISVIVNDRLSFDANIGGISFSKNSLEWDNGHETSNEYFSATMNPSSIAFGINYYFLK